MLRELKTAAVAALVLTVLLGLAYPLAMTGAAQVAFPTAADGRATLIGRDFSKDARDFQGRPSATGYNAAATAFDNQGPNQRALADRLKRFVKDYLAREGRFTPGLTASKIPADAVTTSASGIDPQISEANARIQANRVARERGLPLARVLALVKRYESRPLLGLAGPRSVNVVELNRALEGIR